MGKPPPPTFVAPALAAVCLIFTACQREVRDLRSSPADAAAPGFVAQSTLFAGGPPPPAEDPVARRLETNAYAIASGQRAFQEFNCSGCHAQGGGGMGPSLMDATWRYGGTPDQIYASIAQGRPNGMPAFGSRIPVVQIRELAAYVRTLSGHGGPYATPSRRDAMAATPPLDTIDPKPQGGESAFMGGG
jgi:cytochrome c oxidase cbb3-type subunit 3